MNKKHNYNKEEWGGWKIVSEMLDNPDECGIYPTSECYQKLYEFVCEQKKKAVSHHKKYIEAKEHFVGMYHGIPIIVKTQNKKKIQEVEGKITQVHAEKIEDIINEKIRLEYTKGYNDGEQHRKQHIDEGIEKMRKFPITEKEKPKRGRPRKYPQVKMEKIYWGNDIYNQALQNIKKINK